MLPSRVLHAELTWSYCVLRVRDLVLKIRLILKLLQLSDAAYLKNYCRRVGVGSTPWIELHQSNIPNFTASIIYTQLHCDVQCEVQRNNVEIKLRYILKWPLGSMQSMYMHRKQQFLNNFERVEFEPDIIIYIPKSHSYHIVRKLLAVTNIQKTCTTVKSLMTFMIVMSVESEQRKLLWE